MSAGRPVEIEEGVTLSAYTLDVIEYLQDCFEKLEAGQEDLILSDPFYVPHDGPLSDEKIDRLIAAIDEEHDKEINSFPDYHRRRSGANAKPEWHRLSPRARRAVAEGCMRILEEHNSWVAQAYVPPYQTPEQYAASLAAEETRGQGC
jgi:hypothetical protein